MMDFKDGKMSEKNHDECDDKWTDDHETCGRTTDDGFMAFWFLILLVYYILS